MRLGIGSRKEDRSIARLIKLAVLTLLLTFTSPDGASAKVPLLVMARGQSNMAFTPSFTWAVPPNLYIWNSNDKPGNVGTAFVQDFGDSAGVHPWSETRKRGTVLFIEES